MIKACENMVKPGGEAVEVPFGSELPGSAWKHCRASESEPRMCYVVSFLPAF